MLILQDFKVSKNDLNNWQYFLRQYCNFSEEDFRFLNNPSEMTEYDRVRLIKETESHYQIKIEMLGGELVSRLLPETIVRPGVSYFSDRDKLDELKRALEGLLEEYSSRECDFHGNLSDLVRQLAVEGIIDKFHHLNFHDQYLVCLSEVILLMQKHDGRLLMTPYPFLTFNLDSGFSMFDSPLNEKFREWKSHGDLRRPIFEPNILGTLTKASPRT